MFSGKPTRLSPNSGRAPIAYRSDSAFAAAEIKAYLTGLVSHRLDDDATFGQAVEQLRQLAEKKGEGSLARILGSMLAALSLWRDGQMAQALEALDEAGALKLSGRRPSYLVHALRLYVRAEILFAEGRYEEALPWYASVNDVGFLRWDGLPYLGPSYLRRAEIYEHLGETEKAIDYYTRLVELWKDADPELKPYVEDARAQIDRLVKTRAREPQT